MDGKLDSDGVKPETQQGAGGEKDQVLVPESSPVSVNSGCKNDDEVISQGEELTMGEGGEADEKSTGDLLGKKLVQNNVGGVPMMHVSANRSVPPSGLNTAIPSINQLTIFFNGSVCVYAGIPAEKMHEIMLIAASVAKSVDMKSGIQSPFTSPVPTRSPSPQGATKSLTSTQALCFPTQKSSICGLQEFPIARRHSLQRFLEKRRDRLGSKAPYPTPSTTKVVDNTENSFSADNAPDLVSFKLSEEEFQPGITAS